MSGRTAGRLAWGLAPLAGAMFAAGIWLGGGVSVSGALFVVIGATFAVVGALIAARHPGNPIGWIFCGVAIASGLSVLTTGFEEHWLGGGDGPDALGRIAVAYSEASWMPVVLPGATYLPLLFPDGRLPSRRWRPVAWSAGVGVVVGLAAAMLTPGPLADHPQIVNPLGVEGGLVDGLDLLSTVFLLIGLVGGPAALILRFRRARHEQRQQIKWLALAGAVAALTFVVVVPLYEDLDEHVADVAILSSVLATPIAAGVAILRHRLYDIDVVVNRTLVYGGLTATLVGAYLGAVLVLQLALSPLTSRSDLAIAGSTLAVAALFGPARARIQAAVDRRFYRRRYDAARTLEAFGARLRDQVDIDALGGDLRTVVADTMQPAHVSLWLREGRS